MESCVKIDDHNRIELEKHSKQKLIFPLHFSNEHPFLRIVFSLKPG